MNEQLQTALVNFLNNAQNFTATQMPDIIQQMLHWHLIKHIITLSIFFPILIISLIILIRAIIKHANENLIIVSIMGSLVGLFFSVMSIVYIIELYIAPKWYIVTTITNMIRHIK